MALRAVSFRASIGCGRLLAGSAALLTGAEAAPGQSVMTQAQTLGEVKKIDPMAALDA